MLENTEIVLKDGTLGVAGDAFAWCEGLTRVIISDSVTNIGDYAFRECTSLTSTTIPDSVTYIGQKSFGYYCDWDTRKYIKIDNFTISSYAGTAAEQYARDNGFKFIALSAPSPALGDINGDGNISIADAIMIQKHIANIVTLDGDALTVADVTKDGNISIADAIMLQKYIANIITVL